MSGIAGILDLSGTRPVPDGLLERMSLAMSHRGPDGEALWRQPGIGLAWRQLRTAAPQTESRLDARPAGFPIAIFDGELYDGPGLDAPTPGGGNSAEDATYAGRVVGLWQRHGGQAFAMLRGQFALAIWDASQRQLILARDRMGICPLHWTRCGEWLLFASEIKALLASGMVPAKADLRGIAQVFTFFGLPGPITCFDGVSSIVPGHYLEARPAASATAAIRDHVYWEIDFPDLGQEQDAASENQLVDQYEQLLAQAVQRRLRADVPVVAYSSGGLDSSMIVSLARRILGEPVDTFTFRIEHPTLRESSGAEILGRHLGRAPRMVNCRPADVIGTFPSLVRAAEAPVIDASAAALFRLAEAVHSEDYKVVLTGEGADEWQAGYPWFRIDKKLSYLDLIPGLALNRRGFWAYVRLLHSRQFRWSTLRRSEDAAAGHNAWLTVYNLMSVSKLRYFSPAMREALGDYLPYDDLQLNLDRMRRWHPLHRSLYMGARVHLMGLHLHARGDRSAMHASVEPRYPFLDEDLVAFLNGLHPRWKMRGLQDKYLQRRLADRLLPAELFQGRKRLLHAPLDAFHDVPPPPLVEQLLSDDSLRKAGYFDPQAVGKWRRRMHSMPKGYRRLFVEMGLVGVIATQLWHHAYIDSSLADLPRPSGGAPT